MTPICRCSHTRQQHGIGGPARCFARIGGSGTQCSCAAYAADTADAPSGDALDRATELVSQYQSLMHGGLVKEIAKLIDRADASADKEQIGGHGVVHWHNTAERRMGQIVELEAVVRRRNASIAELESELDGNRRSPSFARTIGELEGMVMERNGRIAELEARLSLETRTAGSEIDSLQRDNERLTRDLHTRDRQAREFLEHSRTANARRAELELELRELRARTERAIEGALETATTDHLVDEIRRRLNT